jgi:hypothetical protein
MLIVWGLRAVGESRFVGYDVENSTLVAETLRKYIFGTLM